MRPLFNKLRKTRSEKPNLLYIYWPFPNLGDIAMRQAVEELLAPIVLTPFDKDAVHRLRTSKNFRNNLKCYCLGGGTLINSKVFMAGSQYLSQMGLRGFSFGTGVCDPSFWNGCTAPERDLAEWVPLLSTYDLITVRGPSSEKLLRRHGIHNVRVVGDPALFFWRPRLRQHEKSNRIMINVGKSAGNMWGGDEGSILEAVRGSAVQLLRNGFDLVIVSVWDQDDNVAREFAESLAAPGRVQMESVTTDVPRFLKLATDCDAVVAIKLHAAVLGLCASRPVVSIEYRPKCMDFMQSIDLSEYNIRADRMDSDSLTRLTFQAIERSEDIYSIAEKKVPYYQEQLRELASEVKSKYFQLA